MNVHAVFLHYLGDAISSMMVLGAGILIHFFPSDKNVWVKYIDPVSSLLIVGLILWTTVPLGFLHQYSINFFLVKRCAMILLQHTGEVKVGAVRRELQKIEGIISVHDLHVWHLVDGMVIGSVHVACEEGVDFPHVAAEVKKIFHSHGIHSSTIQPEFVPRSHGVIFLCTILTPY
jgi:zinc transporter 1